MNGRTTARGGRWRQARIAFVTVCVASLPACMFLTYLYHDTFRVATMWYGGKLVVHSIRGGRVITHLKAYFPDRPAVAQLPSPLYLVDSEEARFTVPELQKLTRKTENRTVHAPPAPGTEIRAVYYEADYSRWEGERSSSE